MGKLLCRLIAPLNEQNVVSGHMVDGKILHCLECIKLCKLSDRTTYQLVQDFFQQPYVFNVQSAKVEFYVSQEDVTEEFFVQVGR